MEFVVGFAPLAARPYIEFANLFVDDIPLAAIKLLNNNLESLSEFLGANSQNPPVPYVHLELKGEGKICKV